MKFFHPGFTLAGALVLAGCAGAPQHQHDPAMHAAMHGTAAAQPRHDPAMHAAMQGAPAALPGHDPAMHAAAGHGTGVPDARVAVRFPGPMRTQTLANMRDHLRAVSEIQDAMANGKYDEAARIAEQSLGMTSLVAHHAHDVAQFMPAGMQALGTAMHRSASQFATEVQTAGATGDLKPALAALARTTQACVGCHAGFRME